MNDRKKNKGFKFAIISIVIFVLLILGGSYAVDRALLDRVYTRQSTTMPYLMLTDADIAADYPYSDVSFQLDDYTLRGHVYGESPDARGLIILRHGIFSQHQDYLAFITALVDRGWKVFAYDAIGCGESDGDSVIGFAQSPIDVHAAVQFARESGMTARSGGSGDAVADGASEGAAGGADASGTSDDELPILLLGHSWGGYGVAGALDYDDGVAGCVALSGFDKPEGIIIESASKWVGGLARTQKPIVNLIGWIDFRGDNKRSAVEAINDSGIPVLVAHGTGDEIISYDGASIISHRDAITNPKVSYLVFDVEGRNGHNDYFYSPESQAYFDECALELMALAAKYGGVDESAMGEGDGGGTGGGAAGDSAAPEGTGEEADTNDASAAPAIPAVDFSVIPDDVLADFLAGIDKRRANTADPALIDQIDAFFASCIS